jgi:DNA-binding XRE family transcriptional regulator
MTTTADFVKRARQRLKLTQAQLAEALGLERRSIVRFEKGEELPLQTRLAIERLLDRAKHKRQRKKNGTV